MLLSYTSLESYGNGSDPALYLAAFLSHFSLITTLRILASVRPAAAFARSRSALTLASRIQRGSRCAPAHMPHPGSVLGASTWEKHEEKIQWVRQQLQGNVLGTSTQNSGVPKPYTLAACRAPNR